MEKLTAGLEKLGIKIGEHEIALFQTYFEELTDWNQRMNLTAITEYDKVQINHFLDSLTVASVWKPTAQRPDLKVIDIGTGAGVPGIPLKIVFPRIRLTLMDSTNKKQYVMGYCYLPRTWFVTYCCQYLPSTAERGGDFSDACPAPGTPFYRGQTSAPVGYTGNLYPDCPAYQLDTADSSIPNSILAYYGFNNNNLNGTNNGGQSQIDTANSGPLVGLIPQANEPGNLFQESWPQYTHWHESLPKIDSDAF